MSEVVLTDSFKVEANDFTTAGVASASIKRKLKQLGIDSAILRRIAVASYEVELNLIIHSLGGRLTLEVTSQTIRLTSADVGPGIADIEQAMTEGYSTAGEEARGMGFGAGMGLPNMKRNATDFSIQSEVGVGTIIAMTFALQ